MKSKSYKLIMLLTALFTVVSCNNEVWDDLPYPVSLFFTNYFPGQEVNSYSKTVDGSTASVKGGVTVSFNSNNSWVEVNGNGSTLPEIFIYDYCCPIKLFEGT